MSNTSSVTHNLQTNCVFCEIVAGRSPDTKIMFETENILIIKDIKPASDHHYLALPKNHITNAKELKLPDKPLIEEMERELRNLFATQGVDIEDASFGFHWPPFTSIPHLHMHGIGPITKMKFFARWIFKPINIWYCTPQYVSAQLKNDVNST